MRTLRVPSILVVTVTAIVGGALAGCGPEHCLRTNTADGSATAVACEDDAGCFHYTDQMGNALFTDCRMPDACSSIRTYPDGRRGTGGDYC